jgi:ribosome maturation factor RimP
VPSGRKTPAILALTHFPSSMEKWARGAHFFRKDTMNQVYEKERELYSDVAERVGQRLPDVEVLAVELRGPDQLAVYLDRPGGVDHALCEQVTNVLRDLLDRYSLEVSSPGIERPVRTRQHFAQAVGRRVALRTARDLDGRKRFRGDVVAAGDAGVTLDVSDGRSVEVPYELIVRGNLIDEGVTP